MGRIRFANQLRGVAALSVSSVHLIGVYWAMPDLVSAVTATLPHTGETPSLYWLVGQRWFNPGPFGVGIFFLISGLVVPFSLAQHSRVSFLAARLLRIFPTYLLALLLEVCAVWASSQVWHRSLPFNAMIVAGNATLLYDLVGQPSIDLVNWTLSVELKFYLVVALLAPLIRRGSLLAVLAAGTLGLVVNGLMAAGLIGDLGLPPSSPSYTLSSHSLCLSYMLIGTLFNFHLRGKIGTGALLAGVAWLAGCFVMSWRLSVWAYQFPIVTVNYVYALALFAACYAIRARVPPNALLDAMASISFPYYLVHSLIGYIVMRTAMVAGGLPYYAALCLTIVVVVLVATGLHVVVELPSQRLGRKLIGRRVARLSDWPSVARESQETR